MLLIIIEDANGKQRTVEEGQVFTLREGEKVIGSTAAVEEQKELADVARGTGLLLGDAVAKMTKAFGIKPCSACEQRRKILNRIRQQGVAETIKQLKETL